MLDFYELLSLVKKIVSGDITGHKIEAFPHTNIDKLSFDTIPTATTLATGEMRWNESEVCMDIGEPNGGALQVGQEFRLYAKNVEGFQISEGQIVYVFGASGTNVEVKLADASDYSKSTCTIAVATENVAINGNGRFTTMGFVRALNTDGWTEGQFVYLSATPGMMTNIAPSYPNNKIKIGVVTRENNVNGEIYVRIIPEVRKFGDIINGNYSGFEDDGTLVNYGNSTTYEDLVAELIGKKLESPSSKITQDTAEGTVVYSSTCTLADYIVVNSQMSHKWKMGSDIHPHIHWHQAQASIPNWMIQYRWQRNGQPKTTAWTSVKMNTNAFTYTSGTLNQISSLPAITPPENYSISDIFQVRVIRDTGNASGLFTGLDLYTGSVSALSYDLHFVADTLGSRTEYTK